MSASQRVRRASSSSSFLISSSWRPCTAGTRRSTTQGLLHARALVRGIATDASPRAGLLRVAQQPLVVRTTRADTAEPLPDGGAVFVHAMVAPAHAPPARPPLGSLTDEEVAELRALRAEDPAYWTQRRLAERFGVQPLLVARLAGPAPAERFAQLEEERQVRHLRQVFANTPFERDATATHERPPAGRTRNSGAGTRSESDQARTNRAKFQREVEHAGGLKAILRQQNIVPKRPRQGMRPPPAQKMKAALSSLFGPHEEDPHAREVSPTIDFDRATRPMPVRSPTPEEQERIRKSLETSRPPAEVVGQADRDLGRKDRQ